MSFEEADPSSAEQREELTPLDRFDRLLASMKGYVPGDTGSQELPQSWDANFLIFLPTDPQYSPSILMQTGHEKRDEVTGKLISGNIESIRIKRSYFEKSHPLYRDNHAEAASDLEKIEEKFEMYMSVNDPLRPIE